MPIWLFFVVTILLLLLLRFAPKLLRLGIRLLRWLHWNWAANFLERHFDGWVLFFRIMLFVIAAALLFVAWTQQAG